MKKQQINWNYLYFLGMSALFLLICSKSSFLYPLNDWVDANCFFTTGKAMFNGKVLYRDIYEQKGPLLYFIHGLAWLVSHDSFIGVYFVEVLAMTFFLVFSHKIVSLFVSKPQMLFFVILSLVVVTSKAFAPGDSAEELCIPLLTYSLYELLRFFPTHRENTELKSGTPFLMFLVQGILAGCILWIKYTMLGFYFAWIFICILMYVIDKKIGKALVAGLSFVVGMVIASLPWLFYFSVNHALNDCFTAYFYNNIFLYPLSPDVGFFMKFFWIFFIVAKEAVKNIGISLFIGIGMLWVLFSPKKVFSLFEKVAMVFLFGMSLLGIYGGGRHSAYYFLILAAFAPLGIIPLWKWLEKSSLYQAFQGSNRFLKKGGMILLIPAIYICSFFISSNTYLLHIPRSSMPQYIFSQIINSKKNPTLLNYGFLDGGFYTAANIVPSCKYFCRLNIPLEEMLIMQDYYVDHELMDFVVTTDLANGMLFHGYKLVSTASMVFQGEIMTYHLYERLEDS